MMMVAACAALASACCKAPESPVAAKPAAAAKSAAVASGPSIDWVKIKAAADIEPALALAKSANKPMFLFWTAAWCPPCNHVKSTIFTRDEFIAKSRSFVPVYVDGDTAGGQALGQRFRVSGYPTMVLLAPDGREVTRLEGSVEPAKYMQQLEHGLAGGASARELLASALGGKALSPQDWRLLAYYSWSTDDQQLTPTKQVPEPLLKLARACPSDQRESCSRLVLQAWGAGATAKDGAKPARDAASPAPPRGPNDPT